MKSCLIFLCLALTGASSCSSIDWLETPPELAQEWRGRGLHVAADHDVLASREGAAASALRRVRKVSAALREIGVDLPQTRGLLLVVDSDDALVLEGDAESYARQAVAWHRAVVGDGAPTSGKSFDLGRMTKGPRGLDIDPSIVLRIFSFAVPKGDDKLALPADLVSRADWIAAVPSDASVEAMVDAAVDAGLAKQKISFWKRMLLAPFMPMLKGRAADEIGREIDKPLSQILTLGMPEAARAQAIASFAARNAEERAQAAAEFKAKLKSKEAVTSRPAMR